MSESHPCQVESVGRTRAAARLLAIAALASGLVTSAAGAADPTGTRERVRDFIAEFERAQVRAPAGARPPEVVADLAVNSDDDEVEVRVAAGTALAYAAVEIHPAAKLLMSIGASKLDPRRPAAPVAVTISLERDGGASERLFTGALGDDAAPLRLDASIDLSRFAGARGTLVFATSSTAVPAAAAPLVSWKRLRLESQGRAATPAEREFELGERKRDRDHPDLILIVVDTLRADALGCYGSKRPTSPAIDSFAASSLVYERARSQSSWTLPSTTTLLTGLDPDEHGLGGDESAFLSDGIETLGERLARSGFTTGLFSGSVFVSRFTNLQRGFETFQWLPFPNARKLTRRVLDWLDDHADERVFAYVHYIDPHAPYSAPVAFPCASDPATGRFASASYAELGQLGAAALAHGGALRDLPELPAMLARTRELYDGEVHYADAWIGELLAGLRARGRLDDAVVVVTADHGEEFFEHGGITHGPTLYEECVRVPLIVHARGLTPGRVREPIEGRAVEPLLCDLLAPGAETHADELARAHFAESIHLVTELGIDGEAGARTRRDALVRGRYKLIVSARSKKRELYDLERDPGEHDDLAAREPERVAELEQELERSRRAHPPRTHDAGVAMPAEAGELLRKLGYAH